MCAPPAPDPPEPAIRPAASETPATTPGTAPAGSAGPVAHPAGPGITPPAVTYVIPQRATDLLRIDDAIRTYFSNRIAAPPGSVARLREILATIIEPDSLNFTYDAETTLDARGTFLERRGNCVSFSFLVVAVARAFGFDAAFQDVDTHPAWNRYGQVVASVQHINVRVETDDGSYVVDLRPDLVPNLLPSSIHTESDTNASAQLYSDVGFFRLVRGDTAGALEFMTLATVIDPQDASAWANLGNVYARTGNLRNARICFEQALRCDRGSLVALIGLVGVLRHLGGPADLRQADKLDHRAQAAREQNPYYQQFAAEQAAERGDWAAADRHLARAIHLKDDDPEFYEQRIVAQQHLGRTEQARRLARQLEDVRAELAARSLHFAR